MSNLEKYLTATEIRQLETRRMVALALAAGWSYSHIAQELHVSPATISHVKKILRERTEEPWK